MNRILATIDVSALYGQVEIGDRDAVEVAQWETGEEPVVSNQTSLCVATRPDADGDVRLSVFTGEESVGLGHEVFAGELTLPSGVLTIDNSIAAQIEEMDLNPARLLEIRVFVEPPVAPSRVNVLICRQASKALRGNQRPSMEIGCSRTSNNLLTGPATSMAALPALPQNQGGATDTGQEAIVLPTNWLRTVHGRYTRTVASAHVLKVAWSTD